MIWAGLALAGALGAVARWLLDTWVSARLGRGLPWGVLTVNVLGCLLLGLVTGALPAPASPAQAAAAQLAATGFLGAFTTFSTVFVDALRLAADGRRLRAAAYLGLTLVLGLLALWAGLFLAG
ncbi:fluoride efflux transporter FluC [Brevibacterium album]|uniref:fluoride efflux transporter FluC n=1 Tax=Brevibacterium album TaxID=417948 RepID=UPI0004013ECF|nr:CrcB family protein [Brevibacterium album]